jgi:hypothetical protein
MEAQGRENRFVARAVLALAETGVPFAVAKQRVLAGDPKAVVKALRQMGAMSLRDVPAKTPVVYGTSIYRVQRQGRYIALRKLGKGGKLGEVKVVNPNATVIPMTYEDASEWLFGKGPVEA